MKIEKSLEKTKNKKDKKKKDKALSESASSEGEEWGESDDSLWDVDIFRERYRL